MSDMIVQVDIGSAQQVNSPKYLIGDHQTKDRVDSPNKKIMLYSIILILENIMWKKIAYDTLERVYL